MITKHFTRYNSASMIRSMFLEQGMCGTSHHELYRNSYMSNSRCSERMSYHGALRSVVSFVRSDLHTHKADR